VANSIGQLLVELGVNSAAFIEGMDKATYKAKVAAKEIGESFEGMGKSISGVFSMFGELGAQFGEAFSGVGDILGNVAGELGGLTGAAGGAALGIGALIAAGAAVEGMFVGLALHSAESAGELYKLSQMTGISVEQLSTLGFAAKEVGVSTETLARSMGFMNKNAFAAETGSGRVASAFSRLKIEVQDTNGHLKDSGELFSEVVGKLSNLDNKAEQIALAKQIFGRGGAELIPLINEGKDGLEELTQKARELGLEVSTKTAKAAEDFEKDLRALKEGATGVGNQLLDALLPVFKAVSESMVDALKEVVAWTKEHASTIKVVAQYVASFGGLVWMVFKDFVDIIKEDIKELTSMYDAIVRIGKGIYELKWGEIKKGATDAGEAIKKNVTGTFDDLKKNASSYADFVVKVFGDTAEKAGKPKGEKTNVDTTNVDKVTRSIVEQVEHVHALADAQLALAAAASQSAAAMEVAKAIGEADVFIKKLETEAAKAVGTEHQKLTAYINENKNAIRAWYAERALAQAGVKLNEELDKETQALARQMNVLQETAAAYRAGGDAITKSSIANALEKDRQEIAKHEEALRILATMPGVTADALGQEQQALIAATAKMKEHEEQQELIIALQLDAQIAKQTAALRGEAAAFEITAAAALKSAAAQREAAAAAARAKFASDNPAATSSTLNEVYANELKKQDEAYQKTILQTAAQYDLSKSYQDNMDKLEAVRKVLLDNGQSTLAIDAAIYDEQNKINKQWDDAAIKVGSFGQKARAILDEVRQDGENLWGSLFDAGKKALDQLNAELAKFLTTGKANFKQVFQGLQESILQASIKKIESSAASGLMNLFGLGGTTKPDGSESNPFHVVSAGGAGGLGSLFGGGGDGGDSEEAGGGGMFGGLSNIFSSMKGIFGGIFSHIGDFFGKIFGGFMATGGDVTPGKAYVVGEKHPEFFVPGKSGSIVPTLQTGGGHTTNLSVHFHGVTDADSFKKSQSQIAGMIHRQASMAYSRGV